MSEPHLFDDEVDLAGEDVCDSQGRRVDSDYVAGPGREAAEAPARSRASVWPRLILAI